MNKREFTVIAIVAIAVAVGFVHFWPQEHKVGTVPTISTAINNATTSSAITVTSSTRVLSTTTSPTDPTNSFTRVYASICNPSATLVYLNVNRDQPASVPAGHVTAVIAAAAGYNACFEITDRNLYQGSVQASSTNQTSATVYVSDYVQ